MAYRRILEWFAVWPNPLSNSRHAAANNLSTMILPSTHLIVDIGERAWLCAKQSVSQSLLRMIVRRF